MNLNKTYSEHKVGITTFLRLVVMVVLISTLSLMSSSEVYSQVAAKENIVNYAVRNQPLKDVIVRLSKETKINISFSDNLIPVDSLVTFSYVKTSVYDILTELLLDTNVEIKSVGNDLVLVKRKPDPNRTYHLYGNIEDFESGEKLMNALIYFPDLNKSVVSNDYGYYNVQLPFGKHKMTVQYLAYKEVYKIVPVYRDKEYNITMNPIAVLNEVVIKNKYDQEVYSSNQGYELPLEMAHSFISVGGEANVMKMIGSSAGVSSAADQISGISVRGGNASQNLVLMDGVPVYNADHALGLFSIFNNDFLKSVKFYKGAFPSRYSGGLSSVIDVKTKDGNFKKTTGSVSLGLFSAKGIIEGPIIKDKASYVFSMRRTTIDPWIKQVIDFRNNENENLQKNGNYYLYDINAKVNFKINKKNKVYLSTYFGKDKFNFSIDENFTYSVDSSYYGKTDYLFNYTNQLYSFRLNTIWNQSLFSNFTAYSTGYNFSSFDSKFNEITATSTTQWFDARLFQSNLQEYGAKMDFDYMGIENHMIKFGVKVGNTIYKPGLIIDTETEGQGELTAPTNNDLNSKLDQFEQSNLNFTAYVEDEFKLYKNLYLNLGVNVNSYVLDDRTETKIDPRLSALYKAGRFSIIGGFSMMTQFNHLLSNNGLGIPFNIWIPTTGDMELEKGWIASFGLSYLYNESTKYSFDAYIKNMNNVYSFEEGALRPINNRAQWESNLPVGNVNAYGIEFGVLKNIGKTVFDLNYTYSFVVNQFDKINGGRPYYGNYDRRHMLNIGLTQKINKNAEFSLSWKMSTGNHVTIGKNAFLQFTEDGNPIVIFEIEAINNHQLPTYHRLDLGFNVYSDFSWGKQKISIGLINAYNRKNPYYLDVEIQRDNSVSFSQYYLLPVLPSLTYSLSFK